MVAAIESKIRLVEAQALPWRQLEERVGPERLTWSERLELNDCIDRLNELYRQLLTQRLGQL